MLVTAAPGHRVPRADDPRKYIECDPEHPVDVPDNSYYHRRIASGELVEAKASGAKQPAKRAAK
ncbi:hypothetical protein 7S12_14 [uncultured Caudovirales phage]|uniref:DUF2635 domain-containing protein n=1 Tax=uncultured Caudovirales phage TaxID=2100421 RepID=A0A2H4JED6_9CAUD|nr:hypothetical protein 7F10_14 [uncultured Caudovirales phage]ASN71101.1 hypothetical protein 3S10_15 [uncultured Caudovirales phage]ASN71270.1 hypothetical protein 7AX5_14 [uncultured Caudovirales phage]ASN71327.1 hypothetical protein 7S12_14 [uncultured Caudovirales phage]ASN71374.1 hypothetical protein 9F3_14 [uncultured Caudovirales phage]